MRAGGPRAGRLYAAPATGCSYVGLNPCHRTYHPLRECPPRAPVSPPLPMLCAPFASWVTSVTSDTLYHDLWRVSEVTHELVVKDRGLPRAIVWYQGAAQSPLRVAHLPGCRTKIALSLHLGPLSLLSLLCDCASPTEFPGLGCSPGRRDSCPPDRSMEDFLAPPGTFFREFIIMLALICSSKATTGATSPQLRHVQSHVQSLETLF